MPNLKIKDSKEFCSSLLDEFLAGGLGRMQKRDIDILVLHLLIRDGQYSFPRDIFKAARELKLTETRIRNLYQEVQLRYQPLGEDQAKAALVELIKKGAFELKGKRFVFVVRNPMLGQYFQEWVASVNGFTDSSFNPNLVSISKDVFSKVLDKISIKEIGNFPDEVESFNEQSNRPGVLKLFIEEFAKSAGSEAGKMSVKALAIALGVILGVAG
jgi:hypothetical protein